MLQEALVRGEFERGEASRITCLPDPSARRVLKSLTDEGLLASITDKGAVWLRFPVQALDTFFPRLYPEGAWLIRALADSYYRAKMSIITVSLRSRGN